MTFVTPGRISQLQLGRDHSEPGRNLGRRRPFRCAADGRLEHLRFLTTGLSNAGDGPGRIFWGRFFVTRPVG
jgi:hypothetical protein